MTDDASEHALGELRRLLLADERRGSEALAARLETLETRLLDPIGRTSAVGEVLPQAVRERGGADSDLQLALRPEVERAIHRSVREEPTVIAEAIYPVMGPVIRRIVRRLFEGETAKSLKPYQVEQIFLIHRDSGLIVAHRVADGLVTKDADMISGMLDAVRSFVQDAFDADDFDGLRSMRVGDVNVRIEWSPRVVLAAVVRGIEPSSLQPALEEALSRLHEEHGPALERFDGDSAPFAGLSLQLQEVLESASPEPLATRARPRLRPLVLVSIVAAAAAAVAAAAVVWVDESADWERAVRRLEDAPGIVVTGRDRGFRRTRIHGLLDRDAGDPRSIILAEGVNGHGLETRWEAFVSDDPRIKLRRAARVLDMPDGVSMTVDDRELRVDRAAPADWVELARRLAPTIDGIDRLRYAEPSDASRSARP